jgi:hypothetical protein
VVDRGMSPKVAFVWSWLSKGMDGNRLVPIEMLSGANAFEISDIQAMKLKPRYWALRM